MNINFLQKATLLAIAFLSALIVSVNMSAQSTVSISGHVVDEDGAPVPGAAVVAKGMSAATTTDLDGYYSLRVPSGTRTLEISCLGMQTVTVTLDSRTVYDLVMKTSAFGLDETVVVGYGTMIKRDLSSSIASVKGDKLTERATAINIMQGLAGKMAGVRSISFSGRPGGNSAIRVRGMGSINAGKDPIYVLDGIVGVSVNQINPADIESIDVLKDAASTAMYGAQGANGVVLITTKKGKKGDGTVSYDGKFGVSVLTRTMDLLNAEEYMQVQERAYAYSGATVPHLTRPFENLFYYKKDSSGNYVYDDNGLLLASPKYDTDWQKAVARNAFINDHTVSYQIGSDLTSVYASVSMQDVQGLMKNTWSKRITGNINLQTQINKWLSIQAFITGGNNNSSVPDDEGRFGHGAVRGMIEMPPIIPVKYEDGTWGRKSDFPLGETAENPVRLLEDLTMKSMSDFVIMDLTNNIGFTEDLVLTVKANMQLTAAKSLISYKAGLYGYSDTSGGYASVPTSDSKKWSNEDYLTWTPTFLDGKLKSNFVLGASWYYTHSENASASSENFFDDFFAEHGYYNLGAGSVYLQPYSGMSQRTMNSYYFRMNHNYLGKYILGFTFRADGASNFGKNNKFGYFPSASAAWLVSEEPFFDPLKPAVSGLKLRASYGSVGNASIPNYRTMSQFSNGNMIFNHNLFPYVVLSNLGNNDLKWETTNQFDVGIDLGLFNDKVEVIADYYNKATKNLLFQKQVPYTSGYSNTWTNLGLIRNKGFELTVHSRNISNRDFQWDTDFIFSTNKIVVADINGETIELGNNARAVEGEEWATWYVYKRLGTWGLHEVDEAAKYGKRPGDIKYEDINKDYSIDDNDRQPYGSGFPKGELSLVNTLTLKNFTFMLDLGAQYGAKLMGITPTQIENRQLYANSLSSVLDAWTPEHQNTMIAAVRRPSDVFFGENEKDSRMIYNGDFLRIRNIMLAYNFKNSLLRNVRFVKGLTFGVNVENAFVFSSYRGFDPEVGYGASYDTAAGLDWCSYPRPMTITGNIKVTF